MICQHCRKNIQDEARFCPYCGKPVVNQAAGHQESIINSSAGQKSSQGIDIGKIAYVPPKFDWDTPTIPKWEDSHENKIKPGMEKKTVPKKQIPGGEKEAERDKKDSENNRIAAAHDRVQKQENKIIGKKPSESYTEIVEKMRQEQLSKRILWIVLASVLALFVILSAIRISVDSNSRTNKKKQPAQPTPVIQVQPKKPQQAETEPKEETKPKTEYNFDKTGFFFDYKQLQGLLQKQFEENGISFVIEDPNETKDDSVIYDVSGGSKTVGTIHADIDKNGAVKRISMFYYTSDKTDPQGKQCMKSVIQTGHGNMTQEKWDMVKQITFSEQNIGITYVDELKIAVILYPSSIYISINPKGVNV